MDDCPVAFTAPANGNPLHPFAEITNMRPAPAVKIQFYCRWTADLVPKTFQALRGRRKYETHPVP